MNSVTVTVVGDKKLKRKLKKIGLHAAGMKHVMAVRAGAEITRTAAVRNVHSKLNRNSSGTLARSIKVQIDARGRTVVIAHIGTGLVYARIHEFGGDITPKSAPYLVFEVEPGVWVTTSMVTIPARPYLRPAMDTTEHLVVATIGRVFRKMVLTA